MVRFSKNLVLIIAFGRPTPLPNFCLIKACDSKLERFLCLCEKKKKKRRTKTETLVSHSWHDVLQFWNPDSPYRQAVPQQIWCSSDKRSHIYECVKITTLLFLLIYTHSCLRMPRFLGPHDTLPCVLYRRLCLDQCCTEDWVEEYLSVIQHSHGLYLEGYQLYQLMILLLKAKSSILEPRVVDTHCSKDKSFIIEYNTEEDLSELAHKSSPTCLR